MDAETPPKDLVTLDNLETVLLNSFLYTCRRERPPRGQYYPASIKELGTDILRLHGKLDEWDKSLIFIFDFKHDVWFTQEYAESPYFRYLAKTIASQFQASAASGNLECIPNEIAYTCDDDGHGVITVRYISLQPKPQGQS